MNIKKEKSEIFEKLVWARMRFFPYWPAKVVDTPPGMGKILWNERVVSGINILFYLKKE